MIEFCKAKVEGLSFTHYCTSPSGECLKQRLIDKEGKLPFSILDDGSEFHGPCREEVTPSTQPIQTQTSTP